MLYKDYNLTAAFAVASLLAMLALIDVGAQVGVAVENGRASSRRKNWAYTGD